MDRILVTHERRRMGLSIRQMAWRSHIRLRRYIAICRGAEATPEEAERIAKTLGVQTCDIEGGD